MLFMVMHKMTEDLENRVPPRPGLIQEMGQLIGELRQAGKFHDGAGLLPTSERVRLRCTGGKCTRSQTPTRGTHELVSGIVMLRVPAMEDALRWAERIGEAVEDYGRHPDIAITGGNRVRIMVSNANAAGITEAELRLVDKVDLVADAPAPQPKPRGALAAVVASAATAVEAVVPDPEPEPEPEPDELGSEPRRGGRAARIVAGLGGLAVGAAALFAARRR